MSRGGPRKGAGAPLGNLNALKHGLRSRQFRAFVVRLFREGPSVFEDPDVRRFLRRFTARRAASR